MDMEDIFMQMEITMKVNLKTIKDMDKVNQFMLMEQLNKDNIKIINLLLD